MQFWLGQFPKQDFLDINRNEQVENIDLCKIVANTMTPSSVHIEGAKWSPTYFWIRDFEFLAKHEIN